MKGTAKIVLAYIASLIISPYCLYADNLRHISNAEGITNNSVLSLAQDEKGLIYLGTCDGANIWNGRTMSTIPIASDRQAGLSGNLIEEFIKISNNHFWIRTNYGLDLMKDGRIISNYDSFAGIYYVCSSSVENTVVLTLDNKLMGYNPATKKFLQVPLPKVLDYESYLSFWASESDNQIIFVVKDGIYRTRFISDSSSATSLAEPQQLLDMKFNSAFPCGDTIFLIDSSNNLHTFSPHESQLSFCSDLSQMIKKKGPVSDIIFDNEDIIISFLFDGIVRLKRHPVITNQYTAENVNIECGVFDLLKDTDQDIIWIATDGQGLFMYSNGEATLHSYGYSVLPYNLSKPVRSILRDSHNNVWVATKGEGILLLREFSNGEGFSDTTLLNESQNLSNMTVYALTESKRGCIYVGTEGEGIDWWSYKDRCFHTLSGNIPKDLKWVHAIYESHPDTLYVATVGCGVFRLDLYPGAGTPRVKTYKKLDFNFKEKNNDFFFAMFPDNDGTLFFGNRGGGLVHYDTASDSSNIMTFDKGRNKIANDVWAITRGRDGNLWIGTSYGLLCIDGKGVVHNTPITHTIHGVLEDKEGTLWISTNIGLYSYNPLRNTYTHYGYSYGIETIEYSDGAVFRDESGTLFFGGTNGFVCIERNEYKSPQHKPELLFQSISIDNHKMNIPSDGKVVVNPGSRLNNIDLWVRDYVNIADYLFSYNIEGLDEKWTTATDSKITFMRLPYGKYTLNSKYVNTTTGHESPVYSLDINIKAPWYATPLARSAYIVFIIIAITFGVRAWHKKRMMKKEKQIERLQAKFKEETLLSRLNIMENFSRELSSPITMISALSQQLSDMSKDNEDRPEYFKKLKSQTARLSRILSTFHYFSESSDIQQSISTKMFSVSDLAVGIYDAYTTLASRKNVTLTTDIQKDLLWNTDPKSLTTIIDILLTNALVNSEADTSIGFILHTTEDKLIITVSNQGVWLKTEETKEIFDKFMAMELFNRKSEAGESFQNEMRLAICSNITEALGGSITYRTSNEEALFEISIPQASGQETQNEKWKAMDPTPHSFSTNPLVDKTIIEDETIAYHENDENRRWMFIIGTDVGIMNVVAGVFAADYNIEIYQFLSDFSAGLRKRQPDVVICENMNLRKDITACISALKKDKKTFRTPVIMLTSMQQADEAVAEGIADVNIPMPFNVKYLKSTVLQSLNRLESLKDYFSSSVSAYEFCEGKTLHREDKEFIEKLFNIIRDNISNSEITTAAIAEMMGVSLRSLYNRLEGSINVTPSNILKEYRLLYAKKLLVTTKMSIDEIIYKSGFTNRGTFFKNFSAKYGCTPRQYRKEQSASDNDTISS